MREEQSGMWVFLKQPTVPGTKSVNVREVLEPQAVCLGLYLSRVKPSLTAQLPHEESGRLAAEWRI
jgi:hypothetical protein